MALSRGWQDLLAATAGNSGSQQRLSAAIRSRDRHNPLAVKAVINGRQQQPLAVVRSSGKKQRVASEATISISYQWLLSAAATIHCRKPSIPDTDASQ